MRRCLARSGVRNDEADERNGVKNDAQDAQSGVRSGEPDATSDGTRATAPPPSKKSNARANRRPLFARVVSVMAGTPTYNERRRIARSGSFRHL